MHVFWQHQGNGDLFNLLEQRAIDVILFFPTLWASLELHQGELLSEWRHGASRSPVWT